MNTDTIEVVRAQRDFALAEIAKLRTHAELLRAIGGPDTSIFTASDDLRAKASYVHGLLKAYTIVRDTESEDEFNNAGPHILCEVADHVPEYMDLCVAHMIKEGFVLKNGMWEGRPRGTWRGLMVTDGRGVIFHCGSYCLLSWPPYRHLQGWS